MRGDPFTLRNEYNDENKLLNIFLTTKWHYYLLAGIIRKWMEWLFNDCLMRHKISLWYLLYLNYKTYFSAVNKWTQELIQSDPHQVLNTNWERQANTIKQPQNEQIARRFGNSFPNRWQLCYPNSTEYILKTQFGLHNTLMTLSRLR